MGASGAAAARPSSPAHPGPCSSPFTDAGSSGLGSEAVWGRKAFFDFRESSPQPSNFRQPLGTGLGRTGSWKDKRGALNYVSLACEGNPMAAEKAPPCHSFEAEGSGKPWRRRNLTPLSRAPCVSAANTRSGTSSRQFCVSVRLEGTWGFPNSWLSLGNPYHLGTNGHFLQEFFWAIKKKINLVILFQMLSFYFCPTPTLLVVVYLAWLCFVEFELGKGRKPVELGDQVPLLSRCCVDGTEHSAPGGRGPGPGGWDRAGCVRWWSVRWCVRWSVRWSVCSVTRREYAARPSQGYGRASARALQAPSFPAGLLGACFPFPIAFLKMV